MEKPPFRVKRYSHRKYKFVVRSKLAGKWKRRYFKTKAEAIAYATELNTNSLKRQKGHLDKSNVPHGDGCSRPLARGAITATKNAVGVLGMHRRAPVIHRYLNGSWSMHLPFAYDLMRELRPRIFVELGVYQGESYFTFCQSVEENGLATQCYGIDTWRGDIHAGFYGPEIGREVAEYNSRYSSFSHLMALRFKEALSHFAEGSIDLLHIDGAHRYEDVKEDFESWRPKLSRTGIILFHDVEVRERGFGVYRLWKEIARPRASFVFEFGYGLGVWKRTSVSKSDSPFLRKLFLADSKKKRAIMSHYTRMAAEVESSAKAQPNKPEVRESSTCLQSFPSRNGAPCAEYSSTIEVVPGRWCRLKMDLPWGIGDGSAPLRFDPADRPGVVDIAAVSIRSRATGEVLWRANTRGGLENLVIRGTGLRLPHSRLLRLLSYAEDPQIYLPHLKGEVFQEPLGLEVLLRLDTAADSIERAVVAWNESTHAEIDQIHNELASTNSELAARISEVEEARKNLALRTAELGHYRKEWVLAKNELAFLASNALDQTHKEFSSKDKELAARTSERDQLRNDLIGERMATVELRQKLAAAESTAENQGAVLGKLTSSPLAQGVRLFWGLRRYPSEHRTEQVSSDQSFSDRASERYKFWLEHPTDSSSERRDIFFSGWVLGPPGVKIEGIRARANGRIFVGQYGFEREDVAAALSDRADAKYSGFNIDVILPVGAHKVSLEVLTASGEWQLFASSRYEVRQSQASVVSDFIEAQLGDLVPDVAEAGFEGSLDRLEHRIANETSYGLFISGWLYSKSLKLTQLVARIRGGANVVLTHGLPRPDVAKAFPQFPSAVASGFDGYVPIDSSFAGCVTLELHAIIEDGTELFCFQREVTLRSPGTSPPDSHPFVSLVETNSYTEWVRTNRLTPTLLKKMRRDANRIATTGPLISIVVPVYNTPGPYLEALIDSVRLQLYPNWQLCFADDASPQPHVRPILERATSTDSRIQVSLRDVNGHIVRASNSALELATGEYVGLLDHDDILSPDALLHVAEAIAAEPALDLLYTDEDKLSPSGERYDPIFKGSFSPEMAITHNYIQHFTVIRRSLLQAVCGFREGFEGAQDLDLYLRVMEKTTPERVRHLPFVCYHWRSHPESTASTGAQKNYVFESARKSIAEALVRRKLRAIPFLPDFAAEDNCCLYQLRWSRELLKENPVTIVIPTKNRDDLLEKCIASLVRTVDPAYIKLIVVDDFSEDESARRYLKELAAGKRLSCNVIRPSSRSDEFNFSQLVNEGVARATTPLVLLLNNDTEAIRPGWLEDMVGWMSIDGVGAVGAKLLYPDSTIQHAGVVVGEHGGLAEHIFNGLGKDIVGVNFLTHAARNVSAVTAACMLTSKAVFDKVNGFDEANFAMEWNDVDYCLRLGQAGKRIVFTPQAVLLHECGKSRGCLGFRPQEHVNFLQRYRGIKDPFSNESLDLDRLPVAVKPRHFVHTGRVGKLKVLVISHNLNFEGAPRVLFDHVIYLSRFGEYQITVVSPLDGPLQNHYERASIPVIIVKDALLREEARENFTDYTQRLQRIGKRLRVEAFDLIICNTLAGFWGVTLAKLFDLPVIWHIHESASLDQFFRFDPILEPVQNCFGSADRVTFVADATRRLFAQHDSRDNFITISGSVDVGAIDEFCERHERDLLRRKHGINTDQTVVSLVGTTCRRKGQHVFLQAIKKLQSEHPSAFAKVCFLMVGARKSPYLEESLYLDFLRAQIESSGATNIRLVEEREDVYDFYRLSDIFVCASFEESFPRVILEAMAFKLGIVSTNVFGIPEMISDGDEALLVSAGDACGLAQRILRLVQEPQNRKQLGDRAHARVSRCFTNRGQLRKHLDLTKEVVARHV